MTPTRFLILLLALASLAPAPPRYVPSVDGPVRDRAELFGKEALIQARDHSETLRREYGFRLRIEVLASPPNVEPEVFAKLSNKEKRKRIAEWTAERTKKLDFEGLFVVIIYTKPSFVQLDGSTLDLRKHDFTPEMLRQLQKKFEYDLGRNPDRALNRFLDRLEKDLRELHVSPNSPLPEGMAPLLMAILLGLAVVLLAVARRLPATTGSPADALVDERPAILGALFGVPAGFWIYDRLFRTLPGHPRPPQDTSGILPVPDVESPDHP